MARRVSDVLRDPVRLAAVGRMRPLTAQAGEAFDRRAGWVAGALGAPVALVNLVDAERQRFLGCVGLGEPHATQRQWPNDCGCCPAVVALGRPLLLNNLRTDPGFADNPVHTELGFPAYAGIPLRDADDQVVGTLCVLDRRPRRWTDRDWAVLAALAAAMMSEVDLRADLDRRDRLLEAFQSAPAAVALTRGPDHVLEYRNPAYVRMFGARQLGVPLREAFPELEPQRFFDLMEAVYRSGQPHEVEEAAVRYDLDGDGVPEERYLMFSYSPIQSLDGGESWGLLLVAVDVTGQVLARREEGWRRQRRDLLARATAAVNAAVEPTEELRALADTVVPEMADACGVYLLDPQPDDAGRVTGRRMLMVTDPALPATLPPEEDIRFPGDDPLSEAVRTRAPVLTRIPPPDRPYKWETALHVEDWKIATRLHTHIVGPVFSAGRAVAALTFSACGDRPAYTDDDLRFVEELAARAAVAVEHGLRYRQAQQDALTLQLSLLTDPPHLDDLEIAVRYRPAREGTQVGGDWYDAFLLPGGDLVLVIGDVVGHDMAAAAAMGQLRNLLRGTACYDPSATPAEILSGLDRLTDTLDVTGFATATIGRLERGAGEPRLRWATAGHPPPVLVEEPSTVRVLEGPPGLVLGVQPDSNSSRDSTVELSAGATLLFYTDGLVETRALSLTEGINRLCQHAAHAAGLPLNAFCDHILDHSPSDTEDDVALLALRVPSSQP